MKVRVIWAIASVVVALVFAACSGTTCTRQANTTPGTVGAGPASIATDHSVYAPGDVVQAAITNQLSTGIIINNYMFRGYFVT